MNDFFRDLCTHCGLGNPTELPRPLTGGFTHRMYALTTPTGRYAVKLLNPEIMQRPGVLDNYRRAEAFEALLEAAGLPILPALTLNGSKMQCVGGQYAYVFDYFDSRVLPPDSITPAHCAAMGDVLARIHGVQAAPARPIESPDIDWDGLASALTASADCRDLGELLRAHLPELASHTRAAVDAASRLTGDFALCHNDMDPKNVLWQGSDFRIIDLECLGMAHPQQEMLDQALTWGGSPLDKARFTAFLQGYVRAGGTLPADAAALFDSRRNYLDWLAYNARRCLFPDAQERAVAREQLASTLSYILAVRQDRDNALAWLEEIRRT